jgi:hypothetical protein
VALKSLMLLMPASRRAAIARARRLQQDEQRQKKENFEQCELA